MIMFKRSNFECIVDSGGSMVVLWLPRWCCAMVDGGVVVMVEWGSRRLWWGSCIYSDPNQNF